MNLEQKLDWKIRKLELAREKDRLDPILSLRLAEVYFQKGYYLGKGDEWFERAIARVSEAIDSGHATSEACTLLANALYGCKEYEAAGEAYRRALELDSRNALAIVGLGNLEKRRGDYQKARECFERAADLAPDLWQAHYNLGRAYYQEAKETGLHRSQPLLEKAIYHLVTALRLEPFENFVGNMQKELGELFLHTRQFPHARKFFTRLTRNERYAPLAHYYLGLTHYALGKYNLAVQNYRNYLKYEPNSALAYAKIGLAQLELGNYAKAREACQKALEIESGNVLALFTIGCTHLDEGDPQKAREVFERVIDVAPDYIPAYVELVKAHHASNDHAWLLEQLRVATQTFERCEGYDGGRFYYQGYKGTQRRRIDVLVAQIREVGPRAFTTLLDLLKEVKTDSLRFQFWEELVYLGRTAKLEEVTRQLQEPELHFSRELGRTILMLSRYLPDDLLMDAFKAEDERLKRAALARLEVKDDIGAYKHAIEQIRSEFSEFQGYLLRALATKGTPEVEAFLLDALHRPERPIRLSAAVALVNYGNERAIDLLERECAELHGAEREQVRELIRIGKEKHASLHKIIRLSDLQDRARMQLPGSRGKPRPTSPPLNRCSVCGRGHREVGRMLAGSRLMICTDCVRDIWRERSLLRAPVQRDVRCSFCLRSVFEADAFYARSGIHICNLCLDLSMGVIEKEEVERFLREIP